MFKDGEKKLIKTVCLNAVRVPNPSPFLTQSQNGTSCGSGGNCYACSAQVIANHFGVLKGTDRDAVALVMDRFVKQPESGRPYVDTNYGMEEALKSLGLEVEFNTEWPIEVNPHWAGTHGFRLRHEFHENMRKKFDDGYLVVAEVCHSSRPNEFPIQTDHWLVLDGYREWRTDHFYEYDYAVGDEVRKAGEWAGARIDYDYHLVDSNLATEGTYWMDDAEYFRVKGGAKCFFVRSK